MDELFKCHSDLILKFNCLTLKEYQIITNRDDNETKEEDMKQKKDVHDKLDRIESMVQLFFRRIETILNNSAVVSVEENNSDEL